MVDTYIAKPNCCILSMMSLSELIIALTNSFRSCLLGFVSSLKLKGVIALETLSNCNSNKIVKLRNGSLHQVRKRNYDLERELREKVHCECV